MEGGLWRHPSPGASFCSAPQGPARSGTSRTWALEATRCQGYSVAAATPARCGTAGLAGGRRVPCAPQGTARCRSWRAQQEFGENPAEGGRKSLSPCTMSGAFTACLRGDRQWRCDHRCCRDSHPKWSKARLQSHEHLKNGLPGVSHPGKSIYRQDGFGLGDGRAPSSPALCCCDCGHCDHSAPSRLPRSLSGNTFLSSITQPLQSPSFLPMSPAPKHTVLGGKKDRKGSDSTKTQCFLQIESSVKHGI